MNKFNIIYSVIFLIFVSGLLSCVKKPGNNSTPASNYLTINNPQYIRGTGTPTSWDSDNDADYKVKIKVQTLDSENNAILYRSYSFTKNFTGASNSIEDFSIEVPGSGYFVIQVELVYLECTWPSTSTCIIEGAGKKEYYQTQTYASPSASNSYVFHFNDNHIIYEDCGC
ncbi:MAG: hypothetical protein JXR34_12115 [Bacteroidales bacterium]|nr:hypothetical protein [Bacteroidales bacterium]